MSAENPIKFDSLERSQIKALFDHQSLPAPLTPDAIAHFLANKPLRNNILLKKCRKAGVLVIQPDDTYKLGTPLELLECPDLPPCEQRIDSLEDLLALCGCTSAFLNSVLARQGQVTLDYGYIKATFGGHAASAPCAEATGASPLDLTANEQAILDAISLLQEPLNNLDLREYLDSCGIQGTGKELNHLIELDLVRLDVKPDGKRFISSV